MTKRIVICADGTWNRPEEDLSKDYPTNVLRLARAVRPSAGGTPQQVFYDWGVGADYGKISGGITGAGIQKNIQDDYRYIVQNYSPGDEIYLFGFSRGAYTVRSLCGMINNCGILKRAHANRIGEAFRMYKKGGKKWHPNGTGSKEFRRNYCHASRSVKFVGVWDTVGALGIPFSFLGLFGRKDEFYDNKLGSNVEYARHAMAIDEQRADFDATIWQTRPGLDLKQVWFVGSHADVGGSYAPDKKDGSLLSDIPLKWMMAEASKVGLKFEPHLSGQLTDNPLSTKNRSYKGIYRSRGRVSRTIDHGESELLIHQSVKSRWEGRPNYQKNARNLRKLIEEQGWPQLVR